MGGGSDGLGDGGEWGEWMMDDVERSMDGRIVSLEPALYPVFLDT